MIATKSLVTLLDNFADTWKAKEFFSLQEILDDLIAIEYELRDEIDREYVEITSDSDGDL